MTWTYLDVGTVRIQPYLTRTTRLKGHRGASGWLSWFTGADAVRELLQEAGLGAEVEPNGEAGDVDGLVALRMPPTVDAASVARAVMAGMQSRLPGVELAASWGTGPGYLDVYREQLKPRRETPMLTSGPAGADFPALESCAECRADAAATQIDIHEDRAVPVCPDCLARYEGRYRRPGLRDQVPAYRGELDLLHAFGLGPAGTAQHFAELATLGAADTGRNHLATVSIDGNALGDFFDRVAGAGNPGLKSRVSAEVSSATRAALVAATGAVRRDGDPRLPVIPHLLGGDDVLVSVVADRAWPFTLAYLEDFGRRLAALAGIPPTLHGPRPPSASAGVVFAHLAAPFRRSVELAGRQLRAAKRQHAARRAAVCWLDVTRDGDDPPARRSAWTVSELWERSTDLDELRAVEASGRATLERLIDPDRPQVSAARLREHARRLDRADVLDPFLQSDSTVDRLADALSIVRWWR